MPDLTGVSAVRADNDDAALAAAEHAPKIRLKEAATRGLPGGYFVQAVQAGTTRTRFGTIRPKRMAACFSLCSKRKPTTSLTQHSAGNTASVDDFLIRFYHAPGFRMRTGYHLAQRLAPHRNLVFRAAAKQQFEREYPPPARKETWKMTGILPEWKCNSPTIYRPFCV